MFVSENKRLSVDTENSMILLFELVKV